MALDATRWGTAVSNFLCNIAFIPQDRVFTKPEIDSIWIGITALHKSELNVNQDIVLAGGDIKTPVPATPIYKDSLGGQVIGTVTGNQNAVTLVGKTA